MGATSNDKEFDNRFIVAIKNELHSHITRIALGTVFLLGGAGFVFVQYAVNQSFKSENETLINKLEGKYSDAIDGLEEKFEWRRYHDYGKNYIYIAELLNETNIPIETKIKKTTILFKKAKSKYLQALNHRGSHGSTYYELAELEYTYPKQYSIISLVNEPKAIQLYKKSLSYYLPSEVSKGWRGDAYFNIGLIYLSMPKNIERKDTERRGLQMKSQKYFIQARDDYSSSSQEAPLSPRIKNNNNVIIESLSKIEK